MYMNIFKSHFAYCVAVWGRATLSDIKPIYIGSEARSLRGVTPRSVLFYGPIVTVWQKDEDPDVETLAKQTGFRSKRQALFNNSQNPKVI